MFLSKKYVHVFKNAPFRKYSNPPTKTDSKMDLSGIIIPIPTPFQETQQQSIDFDKLKKNIGKWEKIPIRGKLNISVSELNTSLK